MSGYSTKVVAFEGADLFPKTGGRITLTCVEPCGETEYSLKVSTHDSATSVSLNAEDMTRLYEIISQMLGEED